MKKIDILITYEHASRELENCALLNAELKNRGYKTKVLYMYSMPKRWNIEAKIIIVPHVYNEGQLRFFALNKKSSNRNVIDLQYEQVLSESSEDGIHNPSGLAMKAHHIAWGRAQKERYLRHGISINNIHETGCISMDLFRKEFLGYFVSKKQIGEEFGIDSNKEWVLFISSFSYANRSKEDVDLLSQSEPGAQEFADISNQSYRIILEWLEIAIQKYPDKVFIYRKHPAELNDAYLRTLESKYSNFRCIFAYSIRQWTIIVDKIYNWYSTSLADVFFAKKTCYILRPVQIPNNIEVSIMSGASFITTCNDFIDSLGQSTIVFPVSSEKIEYFYNNSSSGKMAFQKTADLCEILINNPQMGYDYNIPLPRKNGMFVIKYLYDFVMYEYGLRIKTPEWIINLLGHIYFLKKTASKLSQFNQELYRSNYLLNMYEMKFQKILKSQIKSQ